MKLRILSALAVAGSAALAAPAPASAQSLLDIGKVLLGIPTTDERPAIDYRERAPLVVPPSTNLRQPAPAASPEERRANWPQDPDVAARRRAAADARKPVMVDSITGNEIGGPTRRLTPEQIRAGRVAGQEVTAVPQAPRYTDRDFNNVMGGLATLREMDRQAGASLTGGNPNLDRAEPRREFLTDPPVGLRRPADNAPFRATREGSLGARPDPSPMDIFKESPNTR